MFDNITLLFSLGIVMYVVLRAAMLDRRERDARKMRARSDAFRPDAFGQ
jgi:hypothetical protein